MYSEKDRRSSVRRANDEFLRRMMAGDLGDGVPFCTVMNSNVSESPMRPQLPPEDNRTACDGSQRPTNDGMPRPEGNGGCPKHIHAPSLAMAYAPRQCWQNLLEPEAGLREGTIFAELILPLEAAKCRKETEVRPCR